MKLSPELKAYMHFKRNLDYYIDEIGLIFGDDEKLEEIYKEVAEKFNADYEKLVKLRQISYGRSIERAFR